MKKITRAIIALVLTIGTFAQGTVLFSTRVAGKVDAPVLAPDGISGAGTIPGMTAQLFLVTGGPHGSASAVYTPLFPATTFHGTNVNPLLARYVVVPTEPVVVPKVGVGQQATIVLRVWIGNSYDTAFYRLENLPGGEATITLGGTTAEGVIIPPAPLVGLDGFTPLGFVPMIYFASIGIEDDLVQFNTHSDLWPKYVLESSIDFQSWQPVLTNEATVSNFTVPRGGTNESGRFFRLRGQPSS